MGSHSKLKPRLFIRCLIDREISTKEVNKMQEERPSNP